MLRLISRKAAKAQRFRDLFSGRYSKYNQKIYLCASASLREIKNIISSLRVSASLREILFCMALLCVLPSFAGPSHDHATLGASLSSPSAEWPEVHQVLEVLSLKNYNTRLVVLSTTILGLASGLIGSFLLLRKRSLMGDALSHACLPGVGLAFMVMVSMGDAGKSLPGLLFGATVTGVIGVAAVMAIRNTTKIKDDTAMGIVLSVFFGLGIAILGMVQEMPKASAAGLEAFIYGKAASMVMQDFVLISCVAFVVIGCTVLLIKEFTVLCFDEEFTSALGWPAQVIDVIILILVTAVTVIGLQAVGLILIIAFLITPAAAARFWTNDLRQMLLLAGGIGSVSGWFGSSISAMLPRLPAGAIIVLVAAGVFLFSMFFGTARGVLLRMLSHRRLQRKVGRQHLLRAMYELLEMQSDRPEGELPENHRVDLAEVQQKRSWSSRRFQQVLAQAKREDHLEVTRNHTLRLSESGFGEAARITRNHRLWETYLITHADVAPQHVDRDADRVEHVLGPELVSKLEEKLLAEGHPLVSIPSPHFINTQGRGS